jgi:hypothetical protein
MKQVRGAKRCHQAFERGRIEEVAGMPGESVSGTIVPGNTMHLEAPCDQRLGHVSSDKAVGASQ